MINENRAIELLKQAKIARKNAYAPYSHYHVGAALLAKNGKTYLGCNIENASFSPTCCAERVAVFKAISEGATEFEAIAVAGGHGQNTEPFCSPCGVCRQVLSEFCDDDFIILLENRDGTPQSFLLGELLPARFRLSQNNPSEEL